MMAISNTDIKHTIRKLDFPFCAREALTRVEQLCVGQNVAKHMEISMEIISEFVFCEIERRGTRKRRLNSIQELQLLEVLCDYFTFSNNSNEAARSTVFMALFPPTHTERSRLLIKLVSIAISTKNVSVLSATGLWMQQLGCTSKSSLELAQGLVKDYFILVPKAVSGLQDLPQLAPHFTANFLTAVAEMYSVEKKQIFHPPPEALLEVITQWVSDYPTLCVAALVRNPHISIPPGSMPLSSSTPFPGLFRWCILAPLHFWSAQNGISGADSNDDSVTDKSAQLFSHLHYALIQSLLECCYSTSAIVHHNRENILSAQHLISITEPITRWIKESRKLAKQGDEEELREKALNAALDRLAQALHAALVTNCIYSGKHRQGEEVLFCARILDHIPQQNNRFAGNFETVIPEALSDLAQGAVPPTGEPSKQQTSEDYYQ